MGYTMPHAEFPVDTIISPFLKNSSFFQNRKGLHQFLPKNSKKIYSSNDSYQERRAIGLIRYYAMPIVDKISALDKKILRHDTDFTRTAAMGAVLTDINRILWDMQRAHVLDEVNVRVFKYLRPHLHITFRLATQTSHTEILIPIDLPVSEAKL
jgi:hypothetical protein